jgi:hypothetical protein
LNKFYIDKDELLDMLKHDTKQVVNRSGPIAYFVAVIGVIITLLLLIPIAVLWIVLFALYIPGYFIDLLIIKYTKGNKND